MFLLTFELFPEVTHLPASSTQGLPLFNKVYLKFVKSFV